MPLDLDQLDEVVARVAAGTARAVAICFLHSYRNPVHERAAAERIGQRHPDISCSTSADVVPEHGEYERFVTTVLNASVRGPVSDYLSGLGATLSTNGYHHPLAIMTSSGGVVSTDQAGRLPINLALSGPAGGVAASAYVAGLAGFDNVITCDIGGTSTDVCLIKNGAPLMTNHGTIAGHPNRTFQIEINTIGAGGARSRGATSVANCGSAPRARVLTPDLPATAGAVRSPPPRTRICSSATSTRTVYSAARSPPTSPPPAPPSAASPPSSTGAERDRTRRRHSAPGHGQDDQRDQGDLGRPRTRPA